MVAMMEEYAEIDLIKTRRLQIEVSDVTGVEFILKKNCPVNGMKSFPFLI